MDLLRFAVILWSFVGIRYVSADDERNYRCGVSRRNVTLGNQRVAELGQWPWHAVIYHGEAYKGGGTLINPDYVLTSTQCVIGGNEKLKNVTLLSVHLGRIFLDENPDDVVQIITVSKTFVYPDQDIALLMLSTPARYSEFVIPICIEGILKTPIKDLEGTTRLGWVTGFGATESEESFTKSRATENNTQLKMTQCEIKNYELCSTYDEKLFGQYKQATVFCGIGSADANFSTNDIGGGFYILVGDHWELRGIMSLLKAMGMRKLLVLVNVHFYYDWIKNCMNGKGSVAPQKRIYELKCNQYRKFLRSRRDGICYGSRSAQTVAIIDRTQKHISSGSIISEKFVLTKCPSLIDILTKDVDWDNLWIKQPHVRVIREIYHPDYNPETERHNVWLLELKSPLKISSQLFPACLTKINKNHLHYTTLNFYGYTATNNAFYEGIENQIVLNKQCDSRVRQAHRKHTIQKEEMCTSYKSIDNFPWSGIEGGPLQMTNDMNCKLLQIGIIKDVIPHKNNRYTIVHSQLRFYVDWIVQNVWGNETKPVKDDSRLKSSNKDIN